MYKTASCGAGFPGGLEKQVGSSKMGLCMYVYAVSVSLAHCWWEAMYPKQSHDSQVLEMGEREGDGGRAAHQLHDQGDTLVHKADPGGGGNPGSDL